MTSCFYLLPGARLPGAAAGGVLGRLKKEFPERLAAWSALGQNRQPPGKERLSEPLFELDAHHAWLWKVLSHRTGAPVYAPYEWLAGAGPVLDQEFWTLTPYSSRESARGLTKAPISENQILGVLSALEPVLAKRGLRLMVSGSDLFVCRKTPWLISVAPFAALGSISAEALPSAVDGKDRGDVLELLSELREAARGKLADLAVDGFWLSGGGRYEPIFPPSTFRAVVARDPVVRAWAEAAGIPRSAVVDPDAGERAQSAYCAAPLGERIVLIDALWEPWINNDWSLWLERLPRALEELNRWRRLERDAGIDDSAFVFFGRSGAATLLSQKRGLNPLNYLKRSNVALEDWFIDDYPEEAL